MFIYRYSARQSSKFTDKILLFLILGKLKNNKIILSRQKVSNVTATIKLSSKGERTKI